MPSWNSVHGGIDLCQCASKIDLVFSRRGDCPVKHWCVCQWAFASYIRIAGGCDKIAEIECDATNKEAVRIWK